MADEQDIFGRLCRFCGFHRSCGKYIFDSEAGEVGLLTKIKCIFPEDDELINSDTLLPKYICDSCESTVNYFHEFRCRVKLVQQNLQKTSPSDIPNECDKILHTRSSHVCCNMKKSETLIIRLNSAGIISCLNCNEELHRTEINLDSAKKSPICVCCECGFKDVVEMFSSHGNVNLICPKCTYVKYKKFKAGSLEVPLKTYKCDICQKSFGSKGHLNRHFLTHYGSKPFVCEDCGNQFNQKSSLQTHLLIHKRTNPFSCKWCTQEFRHKQTLANHVVSIHGIASESNNVYECDKCKKKFVQREKLKRHYRSHSGEKPFKCNLCDRTFTQKVNLRTHYKKHEAEVQYPDLSEPEASRSNSIDDQLVIGSVVINSLVAESNPFPNMTPNELIDSSKQSNNNYSNSRNEDEYSEMPHPVLDEADKGKLIQELLDFESMSPENDSLETFSSIVNSEYPDENTTLKVASDSNEVYFESSASNYIMYSTNSSMYDLEHVSQC